MWDELSQFWQQLTKPAPDPTPLEYYQPGWNATDALNRIGLEQKQNNLGHWQPAQLGEEWPDAPFKGMSGPSTIGPADPWKMARLNSQTAWIDWLSPTLGSLLQGQPYDPAQLVGDLAGLADLPAKGLLGAAGAIKLGGKTAENALMHRAVGDIDELAFWRNIIKHGVETQKPMSVVSPGYLRTFEDNPFALLFNVTKEGKIPHIAPRDIGSSIDMEATFSLPGAGTLGQTWKPAEDAALSDPNKTTISKLLKALGGENYAEALPWVSSEDLAGVRLPPKAETTEAMAALRDAMLAFARENQLPIYEWPASWSLQQKTKMGKSPLKGEWTGLGLSSHPITSSELSRLMK